MKPHILAGALTTAMVLAASTAVLAGQVAGVVSEIDRQAEVFVVEGEDDTVERRTFTAPDTMDFEEFIGDLEVGDEIRIEFNSDLCADDSACINVPTAMEIL